MMANKGLFTTRHAQLPACTTLNQEQAPAYAYTSKHKLAQLAVTGCMNQTFYVSAKQQLDEVLKLVSELDSCYVAKAAVYARKKDHMERYACFAAGRPGSATVSYAANHL
jgi:60 kDa SS-A/Ro ribonucleoprotein